MEKVVDYTLTGIDQDGNIVMEVPLTQKRAAAILIKGIEDGSITVGAEGDESEADEEVVEARPAKVVKEKKEKKQSAKKNGRKVVTCGICGGEGHNKKTCPKGNSRGLPSVASRRQTEAESSLSEEVKERIKDMRDHDMTTSEIAKELAGELDMDVDVLKEEVQKVMSRGSGKFVEQKKKPVAMLSDEQYRNVKKVFAEKGMTSEVARETGLPLEEINRAVGAAGYKIYQFEYRKAASL